MSRWPAVEHPRCAPAPPVVLDGATLTPEAAAAIARDGAAAELAPEARARNDLARAAIAALLARGDHLYGVTTGVGALRAYRVPKNQREQYSLSLLRSHACGAGRPLPVHLVRAAMATRANQIGAGGAGIAPELLDVLVGALNAGLTPFTRELGSLGTGDLTNLADIGLALLGEGQFWREGQLIDAGTALADAGLAPGRLGPRDGLAFMSSNAVSIGHAALLVVDARRLLHAWLSVAALSFEAAAADPIALDARIHSAGHRPGQAAIAREMRARLEGLQARTRKPGPLGIQDPYPFRAQPQVDGTVHDALRALAETVEHELNFAGENAQRQPPRGAAGQRDRRPAYGAGPIRRADRRARQHPARHEPHGSAAVPGSPTGTGVRGAGAGVHGAFCCRRGPVTGHPGRRPDRVGVTGRRVAFEPGADRRASRTPDARRAAGGRRDGARGRSQGAAARRTGAGRSGDATARLNPDLSDRPLHPDIEAARRLVEAWEPAGH